MTDDRWLLLGLLGVFACTGEGALPGVANDPDGAARHVEDAFVEEDSGRGGPRQDASSPDDTAAPPDEGTAPDTLVCPPDSGSEWPPWFGKGCGSNADCDEGYCMVLAASGGKQCTVACIESCPDGYGCSAIQNPGGSDALFVCMADTDPGCVPCTEDAECPGGALCVPIGLDDGLPDQRCARICGLSDDGCDAGFGCEPATGTAGQTSAVCLPETGSCICFGNGADGKPVDGSSRPCTHSNEHGTCHGTQLCDGPKGWSQCSAAVPAGESCNGGLDDDCDGLSDEEGAFGCQSFFPDEDADGYGKAGAVSACFCAPGQGKHTATETGDCDDGDEGVHPGAAEVCNGKDDDCDGGVDEDNPGGGLVCNAPGVCQLGVRSCVDGSLVCDTDDPADAGTDPFEECSAASCAAAGYYYGWVEDMCYANAATYGEQCGAAGACAGPDPECEGYKEKGAATGFQRTLCRTAEGCTGDTPPMLGLVPAGADPHGDCPEGMVCGGNDSCCWSLSSFIGDWYFALDGACDDGSYYWWFGCDSLLGDEWDGAVQCSFLQTAIEGPVGYCDFQITRDGCNAFHSAGACKGGYKFAEDYSFVSAEQFEATFFDTGGCGEYTATKSGCFELEDLLGSWSLALVNKCKGGTGTSAFQCDSVQGEGDDAYAACWFTSDGGACDFAIEKVGCNGFRSAGTCENGYAWTEYISFETKTQIGAHWPWDSLGNCGSWTGTKTPLP